MVALNSGWLNGIPALGGAFGATMTNAHEELFAIADSLERGVGQAEQPAMQKPLDALHRAAESVGKSWSGSWLGYQAEVYYECLQLPPPGANFSIEWGLIELVSDRLGSFGQWEEFDPDFVTNHIRKLAEEPDLSAAAAVAQELAGLFEKAHGEILSILSSDPIAVGDAFLVELRKEASELSMHSKTDFIAHWHPRRQVMSRDTLALGQGYRTPPHISVLAEVAALKDPVVGCRSLASLARRAGSHLSRLGRRRTKSEVVGTNVFIGHGKSPLWKELRDFIRDRVKLPWDEFNRVPVAGIPTSVRLGEMLDSAAIAFLVMTAEDEMADNKLVARQNVIHEAGLFQGRLGFTKAIILLEDGCEEFSNIHGIGQLRFPKNDLSPIFEKVREVLEREGLTPVT